MQSLVSLLPFVVIILFFWLVLIRPQQKKQRKVQEMQRSVDVGDTVMLTSGIFAEVAELTDDYVVVTIADGVDIKVVRQAIGQRVENDDITGSGSVDGDETAEDAADAEKDEAHAETPDETAERIGLDQQVEGDE